MQIRSKADGKWMKALQCTTLACLDITATKGTTLITRFPKNVAYYPQEMPNSKVSMASC